MTIDPARVLLTAEVIADLLARRIDVRVEVSGRSMLPLLRGGECATISPAPPASLDRGDLVLRRSAAGPLLLHRLVRITGEGRDRRWWTRGDALPACDESCSEDQILGKVSRIEGLKLPLTPASLRTDARAWLVVSGFCVAAARAGAFMRRVAARRGK